MYRQNKFEFKFVIYFFIVCNFVLYFTGGYGCGKSTIVHHIIQRYQGNENTVLWYVGFDAYSLHHVLVEKHCEQSSKWIVCKSVVDLSLEAKSVKRTLKLSECLVEILERNRGNTINVVIDELDSEDLDKQEVEKVNSILENPEFRTSKIVIAFQSCQKKRQFEQGDRIQKETDICYSNLMGFKLFTLEKSMRFTSSICGTLRSSQVKIEEEPNIYYCESVRPKATEEKSWIGSRC